MILPMERQHSKAVGELHHLYVGGLLGDLGRRVCTVFYQTELQFEHNFGFVYVEKSKVLGFTFGTEDNSRLFKSSRIRWEICLALLKKPWLMKRLLAHYRDEFSPAPEGLYSATDLSIRGKGIGKELQIARHEEFKKRGIASYQTRVDSDNMVNLTLQQKYLGARIKEKFMENGTLRYRLEVQTLE